jgi:DNA-binding beta-propeller fold protein YncE
MKRQSNKVRWLAYAAGAVAPALVAMMGVAAADEVFAPTTAISVEPNGISSFDISYVDPVIGIYILSDRTNKTVDVIDTRTNTVTTQLGAGTFVGFTGNNDTSGPNGTFTVDHRQVWAGDGNSTIHVFDLQTGSLITLINTGGQRRADEGCWDPVNHLAMVANDAEADITGNHPFVSIISTDTFAILHRITMDGTNGTPLATNGIEQCKWNPRNGKFYVNIPEVNGPGNDSAPGATLVISKDGTIEKTFSINHNDCAGPQGMALGPDHQILLGCNAASGNGQFSTVVIDDDGNIIKTLPNESGSDEVWFNPGDGHYFLARSTVDANAADTATGNSMLGVVDSERLSEDPSVTTGTVGFKAHSVAADPVRNQVYVPIPANGSGGTSTICSAAGGSDTTGCIAVFTAPNDDRCLAQGTPLIQVGQGGNPDFLKVRCH